ncbi:hypothetical protein WICMUC_004901 [Wickerhamomyces mucosus]|uniref:DUF202 domain-containing protein n=1 Tax=Wickerhamomyces mucosus TaxID=1378264 RepID=A0A9P8PFJ3_9ASCO|nr:hypothetical protein WICMUC_004901 [Wickerhamomyces mucosus]
MNGSVNSEQNDDIGSLFLTFKDNKKLDIRAQQRTYDGAYTRASIATLSFALLITKLFSKSFLPIGILYCVYGSIIYIIGMTRSNHMNAFLLGDDKLYYKTSGNTVLLMGLVSLISYIILLTLVLRID